LIEQNNLNQHTSRSNVTHAIVNIVDNRGNNQILSSKKEFMQKLKNCNTLDRLNMSAFEFLKKLVEQERLSITYKPRKKDCCDCCEVEMYLKIVKDKSIMFCFNTGETNEEAKNAAAKTALGYFKHFLS